MSKQNFRMDTIKGMLGIFIWEKVLTKDERGGLPEMREIGYAVWQ